jgi:ABC-type branched-subunit amino acid transport system substrate-binding protein
VAFIGIVLVITGVIGGDDATVDPRTSGDIQAPSRVVVGNVVSLTGPLSGFGEPEQKAAHLAEAEIRRAISEVDAKYAVEVVDKDDRSDASRAVEVARQAVRRRSVCMTGAVAPSIAAAVASEVAIPVGVAFASVAPMASRVRRGDSARVISSVSVPEARQGDALAIAMERDLGGAQGKIVNIAGRTDTYGAELSAAFRKAWRARLGRIGSVVSYRPGARYDAVARSITRPKPSAYAIFDYPDSFARLRAALLRTEWDPDVTYVTDTLASSALAAAAGTEGEGVRGTTPGIFVNSPAARAFDQLFAKAKGPDRQIFDAQEFDAVVLCYLATVAAGTSEPGKVAQKMREISSPGGTKYSWQLLPAAIRAVEHGKDIDYEGASGPIDLDHRGDATAGVYDLFQYRDRKLDIFDQVLIRGTGQGSLE